MCILTQKYRYPSNRDSFSFHIHIAVDSLSISCRLPGCREERRRRSANWHSIFLSWFSGRVHILNSSWSGDGFIGNVPYMWAIFRMLLNIEIELVFDQHFIEIM